MFQTFTPIDCSAAAGVTYLFFDQFTTEDLDPVSDPRDAEPGAGTWDITNTDAGNHYPEIVDGKLKFVKPSPSTGQTTFTAQETFTEKVGRAFQCKVGQPDVTEIYEYLQVGFWNNLGSTIFANLYSQYYRYVNFGLGNYYVTLLPYTSFLVGEGEIEYVIQMRGGRGGIRIYEKRPTSTKHKLLWDHVQPIGYLNGAARNDMLPAKPKLYSLHHDNGTGVEPTVGDVAVVDGYLINAPLASDSFNRANSTSLGSTDGKGHLEKTGGNGVSWSQAGAGDFEIKGGRLEHVGGGDAYAFVDVGQEDIHLHVTARAVNNSDEYGVVFRYVDTSNHWLYRIKNASHEIVEVVGGTPTVRYNRAVSDYEINTDFRLYFKIDNDTTDDAGGLEICQAYCFQVDATSPQDLVWYATITTHTSATKHGVFANNAGVKFSSFAVFNLRQTLTPGEPAEPHEYHVSFYDQFTIENSTPIPNPVSHSPANGWFNWDVTEPGTTDYWEMVEGELICTHPNPAWDMVMQMNNPASIANVAGRTLSYKMYKGAASNCNGFGGGIFSSALAHVGSFYHQYPLYVYENGVQVHSTLLGPDTSWHPNFEWAEYAYMARGGSLGGFYFMRNEGDHKWTLLHINNTDDSAKWPVELLIKPYSMDQYKWDDVLVMDMPAVPLPAASDSFDRADSSSLGSTDGNGHGEADGSGSGLAWSGTGTIETISNKAEYPSGGSGEAVEVVETGKADFTAELRVTYTGSGAVGFVFRYSDSDNYWLMKMDSAGFYLIEVNAGVPTTRATMATPITADFEYRMQMWAEGTVGLGHILAPTGGTIGTYVSLSSSFNQSATKCGLYADTAGCKLDNFTVYDRLFDGEIAR